VTLSGPSGVGKTRLARQILAEVEGSFEGGWFCDLIGAREIVHVEAAVARALGISDKHEQDLVRAISRRGKLLLVLDNLDTVASRIGEILGNWIDTCPELQILATSILPIGIEGEVRFDLGPLETSDAVELYLERARRASAGKVFTEKDEQAVEELVSRLDRHPLAIELAAARVQVLPPQMLLSRFDERFRFLRVPGGDGRHGSLLGALTMTWDLLSEAEQTILSRASVFEGGFTLEAAMQVLARRGDDVEFLDLLGELRSKALLQLEESEVPRYLLFESVRDFAAEKLRESGLLDETLLLHSTYFVEHGKLQAERLHGPSELEAAAWLHAERENLIAVLHRDVLDRPKLATQAGLAISALAAVEAPSSPSTIHLMEETLRAARRSEDPLLLATALGNHASSIIVQDPSRARSELEEGLALAEQVQDAQMEGDLLVREASLQWLADGMEQTEAFLERAVEIGIRENLPLIEVRALLGKGALAVRHRRLQEADSIYERVISVARRHGYQRFERFALVWVASVWMGQGRFREAREVLHDALSKLRQARDRPGEANALTNLGALELAMGNLDDAERHSLEAQVVQREVGSRRGEGLAIGNQGNVALERGDLELAESCLLQSLSALKEAGHKRTHTAVLPYFAVVEARLGRAREAQKTLEEARRYFREVDDQPSLLTSDILEGTLELAIARRLGPNLKDEAERLAKAAQERLEEALTPGREILDGMFQAIRILEKDLSDWTQASGQSEKHQPVEILRVGFDAAWFELPGQDRVELRGRVSLCNLLGALAKERLASPGTALGAHQLFEAGWPGVEIHPDSAASRVYVSIWRLRAAGLSDVLLKRTDGYLLDPAVPLVRAEG